MSEQLISENTQEAAGRVWAQCLSSIEQRVNTQSLRTWFEPISVVNLDSGKLILSVPSQFFYDWIEEHYSELILDTLTRILGSNAKVEFSVREEEHESEAVTIPYSSKRLSPASPVSDAALPVTPVEQPATKANAAQPPVNSFLNSRYTFDYFIKGDSNQLARAAALAVANNPGGTSFNPLLIYGGVGLGKTHLIQAIGNHILNVGKAKRVMYISSEKFTVEFVDAIQSDKMREFTNFYRSLDLLIVDDIQFFSGKEKTQDNFFHTFNALHQSGKQIVLSCDRPPKELKGLDDRLLSRFQWGLIADIQPPDLETRIAILRKKSEADGIDLPQDVIEFLASNVTSNIRELEGCLITLLARASLESKEIDVDLAKDVVRKIIGEVRTHLTIEDIQRSVCNYLNIPEELIRAKTRKQEIVNARQIAMYLCKEMTNNSLKTIGLHFGGRDHSTVIHAYQTVEDLSKIDPKYRSLVQQLRGRIEARS